MAEKPKTVDRHESSVGQKDGKLEWEKLVPVSVDYEDAMNREQVREIWQKMYKLAKLRNPSEEVQAAFRLAVYMYACLNGSSRAGNYAGLVTMSDGTTFPASVISQSMAGLSIRRFLRGNMNESYEALKMSRCIEQDERYVQKVFNEVQAPASCAFATADWLTSCPLFTPEERKYHLASFNYSIRRARLARGNRDLESVEKTVSDEALVAGAVSDGTSAREVTF